MQQSATIQRSLYNISPTTWTGGWIVVGCALATALLLAEQVTSAVAVFGVMLTLALLIQPQLATVIVVFLVYSNALPVANTFHGLPAFAAAALPLLLISPLFHEIVVKQRPVLISLITPWILGFLGVRAIGVLVADQPDVAFKALATSVAEGLLFFLVLTNVLRTPAALRGAIWAAVLAGLLLGALGTLQYVTGSFDSNYGGFAQVDDFDPSADPDVVQQPRLAGPLAQTNRYAHFMLMLLPLALCLAWTERNHWLQISAYVAVLCIAVGIALTLSRGAAVGFGALIVALSVLGKVPFRYMASLAVIATLILLSVPQYTQRLHSVVDVVGLVDGTKEVRDFDTATVGRLTEMWAGLQVFMEHPIVGVGGGMFRFHFEDYAGDLGVQVHTGPREAHNLYLGIAAEHGLLGLLFFLAIVIGVFKLMVHTRNLQLEAAPEISSIATAFMLSIVVYLTVGIFADFAYERYFWLMMALACATYHISAEFTAQHGREQSHVENQT